MGEPAMGLGCMRLSAPAVSAERAAATIAAALDAGVTWLDTANVYAPTDDAIGHNERLVGAALAEFRRARGETAAAEIRIATKGGLVRGPSRWQPDGRAKAIIAACEASLRALDVAAVDLYLLHAVDPRVAIETSARALESLRRAGLARAVGLSNVTVRELDAASRVATISAVQVRAGPNGEEALRSGIAAACAARGLLWMAHAPFGGADAARLARDAELAALAARLGVTPAEALLLRLVARGALPLPGATRPETARSCGAVLARARLDDAELRALASVPSPASIDVGVADARDVVMILGGPASGKTTAARELVERGYARLNRDERGGRLDALAAELEVLLRDGATRVVLDNTYPTRVGRSRVIEAAARHGARVRCVWIDASIEDAQHNACARLVDLHGSLPMPEDLTSRARTDPHYFGPGALYRARRAFEPPADDEGFASIERRPFQRAPASGSNAGVILDASLVWASPPVGASLRDIVLLPGRREALARAADDGRALVGTAWLPDRSPDEALACLDALSHRLGLEVRWTACVHPGGPPVCWCRRPLPGLGVALLRQAEIAPARCVVVSRSPADRAFAKCLGVESVDHEAFFRVE